VAETAGDARSLLVIGVGNRDRGDDAAGPIVCDHIRAAGIDGVEALVFEGSVVDLAMHWDRCDRVVIVDAAAPAGRPGRVTEIDGLDAGLCVPASVTSHTIDVAAGVELARALGRLPAELRIIAIEGETFDHGADLTPAVQAAVDAVVARLGAWRRRSASTDGDVLDSRR
jgi:hydrogenase maturation protease